MIHRGLFISFEGTECSGKSTQVQLLCERLESLGYIVQKLREPGGTPIGEEIRHTLKHSPNNSDMTPETELLLMNASRAQLVREKIRPALSEGKIVVCDRFYDSTTAYQGYGRQLNLSDVQYIIDFAVGDTRPDLTLLIDVPLEISFQRRQLRNAPLFFGKEQIRDRIEDADFAFFERVHYGFQQIAKNEPDRVKIIDGTKDILTIAEKIWQVVEPFILSKKTELIRNR